MKSIYRTGLIFIVIIAMSFTVSTNKGYKIGDTIDDFLLKNVNGKKVSLEQFTSAKGFIIVFTCNMCPYSKMYENRLIALDKKYKKLGYPVIAINPNDPVASPGDGHSAMMVRARNKGFTFPYLFDEGQKVYPKFGATKTPHVYIVQKDRSEDMIVEYIGAIDDNAKDESSVSEKFVENAVDALLSGKKPSVKTTKAIGCSIKVDKNKAEN